MNFSSIAHRDMKPHNVLINQQTNKVVICDFGSAKQLVKGKSYSRFRLTKSGIYMFEVLSGTIIDFWGHELQFTN